MCYSFFVVLETYKWQNECIEKWFSSGQRGIAEVATGCGKTRMAILCAKKLMESCEGECVIFVIVPRISLLGQWRESLIKEGMGYNDIATYTSQRKSFSTFTIIVIDSARYILSRKVIEAQTKNKHVFLIADECHHYTSDANKKVFEFLASDQFNPKLFSILGLSATLKKSEKKELGKTIGPVIYEYDSARAIRDGIISQYKLFNIATYLDIEESEKYDNICFAIKKTMAILYKRYPHIMKMRGISFEEILSMIADDELVENLKNLLIRRRKLIINSSSRIECFKRLISNLPKEKIIIFSERIEQADIIKSCAEEIYPNSIAIYHSQMDQHWKKRELSSFRSGEKRIIISCKALDEGLDVPSADVAIILSSSDSERQRVQRLGRVLRKAQKKLFAAIYYIYSIETVERSTLLATSPDDLKIIDVKFVDDEFINPEYIALVHKLVITKGLKSNEDKCHFQEGIIRIDYLKTPSELDVEIAAEKDDERREYLKLMKMLSVERCSLS